MKNQYFIGTATKADRKIEDIIMTLKEFLFTNTEIDRFSFGKFVRQRREELGMSVRTLASELELTPAYISDIEKGNRSAPKSKFDELRGLLDIPEEDATDFADLASATRNNQYEDINPYLGKQRLARVALRKARDYNISDDQWKNFIDQMQPSNDTNAGN